MRPVCSLVARAITLRSHYCSTTLPHASDECPHCLLRDAMPCFLHTLLQLRQGLVPHSTHMTLHQVPHVLNGIEVWRAWWVLPHTNTLILEHISRCLRSVDSGIILHEPPICLPTWERTSYSRQHVLLEKRLILGGSRAPLPFHLRGDSHVLGGARHEPKPHSAFPRDAAINMHLDGEPVARLLVHLACMHPLGFASITI